MVSDERKKIKLLWVKTPKCGGTCFVHTIRNQLVFDGVRELNPRI